MTEYPDHHIQYLRLAITEAEKCTPIPTAFCVGCVLVARLPGIPPVILATGYSRELPGNTHAEANALLKGQMISAEELSSLFPTKEPVQYNSLLPHTDIYTTLEPCSIRTSGLRPCADALVESKIKRCIIGVGEPDDFVQCEGAQRLKDAGIEVIWLDGLQEECLAVARRGVRQSQGSNQD
ncbi:diaminohydroxyphosphoribosylamino-pyrimidine deaminase [Phlegmacium glaucopus]|nr:diaminohydroxyphosphoribosylamino-pyrimidine deaminase [Phlegmacium glaucopus]